MRKLLIMLLVLAMPAVAMGGAKEEKKVEAPKVVAKDWRSQLPSRAEDVAQYLQDISVTIKSNGGEGSGVVKTVMIKDTSAKKEGKINFVWTAAHVVDSLRTVDTIIDPTTGTERQVVKFKDAEVVKELVEEGRRVGELKMAAEIVRFSKLEDLAVLRIRKRNFVQASAVFYLDDKIPVIGTELYHVGSLLGQMGSNSMTSGIISQIGRIIDKKEFDQTTATAFPGSSGGGLYLKNGAYMGMLVRGAGEGFNLCVPVRRIQKWAKDANVLWALDDNVSPPTEAELQRMPVEDTGVKFNRAASSDKNPDGAKPVMLPNSLGELHNLFK